MLTLISFSHSLRLFSSLTSVRQLPPRRTCCILPLLLRSKHMHQASKEVLDFIDATGKLIPQLTGQFNLLRPSSINALAFIGDAQLPSSTSITSSSTTKSTSRSISATPSSSTASSTFPCVHLLAGRHPRYQSSQFTLSLSATRSWLLRRIYFSFSGVGNGAAHGFKNTAINARMANDYVI